MTTLFLTQSMMVMLLCGVDVSVSESSHTGWAPHNVTHKLTHRPVFGVNLRIRWRWKQWKAARCWKRMFTNPQINTGVILKSGIQVKNISSKPELRMWTNQSYSAEDRLVFQSRSSCHDQLISACSEPAPSPGPHPGPVHCRTYSSYSFCEDDSLRLGAHLKSEDSHPKLRADVLRPTDPTPSFSNDLLNEEEFIQDGVSHY